MYFEKIDDKKEDIISEIHSLNPKIIKLVKEVYLDKSIKKLIIYSENRCVLKFVNSLSTEFNNYLNSFVDINPGINTLCLCDIRDRCEILYTPNYKILVSIFKVIPAPLTENYFMVIQEPNSNEHTQEISLFLRKNDQLAFYKCMFAPHKFENDLSKEFEKM